MLTRGKIFAVGALLALGTLAVPAEAATLPTGFQEQEAFSGLNGPTAVRFASDGRVFVAEKGGRVLVFDDLEDISPDVLVSFDLNVFNNWDRGLLGLEVDPDFANNPYIYVLYTYNKIANDPAAPFPRWPDDCPDPPGATDDGCTVDGRLSRFEVSLSSNTVIGVEQVLLEERWCQQYPSHSVGSLVFDPLERMLYVTAGDGASFNFADFGQGGGDAGSPTPENVCDDPPVGVGGDQSAPSAEGGALRSQDLRTSGDPVSYDGALLRVDPDDGSAPPDNPLIGGDPGDDHVVAYGLRNPFRMAARPGTHEMYIGDVGWNTWEEINHVPDTTDAVVENFGWPCYEGSARQGNYDGINLNLCENLYSDSVNPANPPYYEYRHGQNIDPDPNPFRCSKTGSSSISGVAFYDDTVFPASYQGAMFFADYSRDCVFVMFPDGSGAPDPSTRSAFIDGASNPVDLQVGPDGLLYYVDLIGSRIMRVRYSANNSPPVASLVATPTDGPVPMNIFLDATGSTDPDAGDTLSYAWDLDDDGNFDNSSNPTVGGELTTEGVFRAAVRVSDAAGEFSIAEATITAGNSKPTAQILTPGPTYRWQVADSIQLQGQGTDPDDGSIAAANMDWEVILHHCPNLECHEHPVQTFSGTAQPQIVAPDHEWYSYLEVRLTVTDSGIPGQAGAGPLSDTVSMIIDPETTDVTLQTDPPGLDLAFGGFTLAAPFAQTVIEGSINSVTAISPQTVGGDTWIFSSWSDEPEAQSTREIVGPTENVTYTAVFVPEGGCTQFDSTCDGIDDDCDGDFDEDFVPFPTQCGSGVCASNGTANCLGGQLVDTCDPGTPTGPDDDCNGLDEDCDGAPDNHYPSMPTTCGEGACSGNSGAIACSGGVVQDSCDPFAGSSDDSNCDGVDDDCDGTPDDEFPTVPTDCGLGECSWNTGAIACVDGSVADTCDPLGGATVDDVSCNGMDDDCDGSTDEDVVTGAVTCGVGECAGNSGTVVCVPEPTVIYGSNRDGVMQTYNLDTLTDQTVGTLLFGTQAMELDPATGRIYYFENFNTADEFAYWDPTTGLNTLVRTYTPSLGLFPKRLAVSPNGTMYLIDNTENMYIVDKVTGDLTLQGTVTGLATGSLGATGDFAFGSDGVLYVVTYDSLYTLDLETLQATLLYSGLINLPGINVFTGAAFCNGRFYASDVQESTGLSAIYTIDLDTGQITELWLGQIYLNDLTSCPSNGRIGIQSSSDTCDPFAGASPDLTCNGLDEDCDGTPDNGAVPPTGPARLDVQPGTLAWDPVPLAQYYQVVRGNLTTLSSSAGDFAAATDECLASAETGTAMTHAPLPAPGEAWWFLVAPGNCAGNAGFESGGAGQSGVRSAEIAADPDSCP